MISYWFDFAPKFKAWQLFITRKAARAVCEMVGPCEWHHTGKYARLTAYYDIGDVTVHVELAAIAAKLPAGWRKELDAAIRGGGDDMYRRRYLLSIACYRIGEAVGRCWRTWYEAS